MNIVSLAETLHSQGIISRGQKNTLAGCLKGCQSDNYITVIENTAKDIGKWHKALTDYGYSKGSSYSKGLVKAIKDGVKSTVGYVKANINKTPLQSANSDLKNSIGKINNSIPEKGDKLTMNVKSTTLEVIAKCNEALEAYLPSTAAKDVITRAQAMLKEIAEQVQAAVDATSKNAADKANQIFDKLQSAVNSYVTGNTSTKTAVTALEEAKEIAVSWTNLKISRFAKEARESDVKGASKLNETILNKAEESEAINKVSDVSSAIDSKLDVVKIQEEQIEEMMKTRQKLSAERDGYLEKIELVKADWMAKTISSVDAQQLILGHQQNQANIEDEIDMYNARISQLQEAVLAQKGKLNELKIIIGNAKFFAVNSADIIVPIAENIDFDAIHAYLNGSSNDIVIDKICRIDAVANIIAKKMKMSADEAKNKLREVRGFVSMGQKTTVTLEEKMKKSQQQQVDADDFMNSLMNGGKSTKVENPQTPISNGTSTIKISAGEEDI